LGVIIALFAAAAYGAGDFFGGLASKREPVLSVVALSGACGLATATAAALWLSPHAPPASDLSLGALAGLVGAGAIGCLYHGLAVGRMSVVAPITAVIAAIVPVCFGIAVGERPSAIVVVGIVLALVAVALVSAPSDEDVAGEPEPKRSGIAPAIASGIGFGLLYVILSQTSRGMWPLVAARCVSVSVAAAAGVLTRRIAWPARRSVPTIVWSGALDMLGNILFLVSLRYTLISIAAVLTSLYPASTVVLARFVLSERLAAVQWAGVACAAVGIAMIARG
jgi:drug/metabolite transporter (DMT)-like permease